MTTTHLIQSNLASVRKELAEVFPRLADDLLDWAPSPGMRTVHGQFVEMISTEQTILHRLKGLPAITEEERDRPLWEIKTLDGLIEKMAEVRRATLEHLESLDETALSAPFGVSEGFANWLELESVPVSELFRFIGRHESYHCGQLVAYLWARGDDPYKW